MRNVDTTKNNSLHAMMTIEMHKNKSQVDYQTGAIVHRLNSLNHPESLKYVEKLNLIKENVSSSEKSFAISSF